MQPLATMEDGKSMMRIETAALMMLAMIAASPAAAREEGWLSRSIIAAVAAKEAESLNKLFTQFRMDGRGSEFDAAALIAAVSTCTLTEAEDRVFHSLEHPARPPEVGALVRYDCGPAEAEADGRACRDVIHTVISGRAPDNRRTITVMSGRGWSTARCGAMPPPAPRARR
jgi:hypothetical protein